MSNAGGNVTSPMSLNVPQESESPDQVSPSGGTEDKRSKRLDNKIDMLRSDYIPQMVGEAEDRLKDHMDLMKGKMEKKIKENVKNIDTLKDKINN